tara:strand:- start:106 stop:294 length:189 start_codon:yes stop_codon:yes gene_type:complete
MVKKLKSKRKKFRIGGNVMPSAQKPFSGFTLTMDQLTPVGKPIRKANITSKKKVSNNKGFIV